MQQLPAIDVTFDIRSDAAEKDPDRYSPTLRRYHQTLWGKPLPDGTPFRLKDVYPKGYLRHSSHLGEFSLSSDMINRTFRRVQRYQPLISQLPASLLNDFSRRGRTIGGTIVFSGGKVDGKHTINQARGVSRKLEDRFDLTLECIRRHYAADTSPLTDVLSRYADFFELFGDFNGYISHFLLQDLVGADGAVRFFSEWEDFSSPAMPQGVDDYVQYSERSLEFVDARNERIRGWMDSQRSLNASI